MPRIRRSTAPSTKRSTVASRMSTVDPSMRASQLTVNATQAKNQFGEILRRVREASPVFIEKHGTPIAVVLDVQSYEALRLRARDAQQIQLDALRDEFEAMYADMQRPKSRRSIDRLSNVSDNELNSTAKRHAKRHA